MEEQKVAASAASEENTRKEPVVLPLEPAFPQADAVTVVFGADNGFIVPLVPCIQSILDSASPDHCYDIVVLVQDFLPEYTKMLTDMVADLPHVSLRVHDVSAFVDQWKMGDLETGHRLSLATYYRLFIPDLFPSCSKVLYLDGDTVVLEDLYGLFHTELGEAYAGVVLDANIIQDMSASFQKYVHETLGMEDTGKYFNAGVMLLNLDAIRRDFPLALLMEQARLKGAKHHDQDVLNSLFYGHVVFLNLRYNMMWLNESLYLPLEGGREALEHPAIIHFSGGGKPWVLQGSTRPAAAYFWKYADSSPLAEGIRHIFDEDCRKAVAGYAKHCKEYLRYRVLSKITWGRTRRHYQEKAESVRKLLMAILEVMDKAKR